MNLTTSLEPADAGSGTETGVLPFPAGGESEFPQPVVTARGEHSISRRDIDPDALKVLYRLARNDFTAYLVGGGVRDLLLGRKPKDFDISTNARPEEIRALFRNCILIGRRFRLAHVRYGEKIIETSTFRRTPEAAGDPSDPEADLFQRDDNLFGSPHEDAMRRDFTVNGLFYDIDSFSIIDYVGGMDDLAARRIRCIGDPCIRFREDPVRMVRAVRFASRLDFTMDPDTLDAVRLHADELAKASPARLLEEIVRLFAFSSGEKAVRLLHSTRLLHVILPEVAECLDDDDHCSDMFWRRLRSLDRGDTVLPDATPALIFSVLFLDPLQRRLGRTWTTNDFPRLKYDKVHAFLEPISQRLRLPRRLVDRIVHMYLSQSRFASPGNSGKRGAISNFVTQESFHESLAFAEILLETENGQQSRLSQWRDMLAERLFGGDPCGSGSRRQRSGENGGGNGNSGGSSKGNSRQPAAAAAVTDASPDGEDTPGGKKLSRSARRRRNKRLRRIRGETGMQSAGNTAADTGSLEPETAAELLASASASIEAAPAAEAPAAGEEKKPRRRRGGKAKAAEAAGGIPDASAEGVPAEAAAEEEKPAAKPRRGRAGKSAAADTGADKKEAGKKPGRRSARAAAPEPEAEEETFQPLTAAAFYAPPSRPADPEPEEKAARPGKKPAAKKTAKASAEKKPAARGKKAAARAKPADEPSAAPAPLQPDRADEADTPMHWLDEI